MMPCSCFVIDKDARLKFVNAFLCERLSLVREEVIGESVEILLTVASRVFFQTHLYPMLALDDGANEVFMNLRSTTQGPIPVIANGRKREVEGETFYFISCITIWERQKYEDELRNSRRIQERTLRENEVLLQLKRELEEQQQLTERHLSLLIKHNQEYLQLNKVLSHDLQEPIRKIRIYLDLLTNHEKLAAEPELLCNFYKIQKSVVRLETLTHCLHQFVNFELSEEPITTVRLLPIVEEAREEVINETGYTELDLRLGDIIPSVELEGKPQQLRRVIYELLKNSVQQRNGGLPLTVYLDATHTEENIYRSQPDKYFYQGHIRLEISDNGRGFDNRYANYVFGLFNKLDHSGVEAGMGLSICRQIITHHFGNISLSSAAGKGTKVLIILPKKQGIIH